MSVNVLSSTTMAVAQRRMRPTDRCSPLPADRPLASLPANMLPTQSPSGLLPSGLVPVSRTFSLFAIVLATIWTFEEL